MLKKGTILITAFNEYIIDEQVGQGGVGTVFKAKSLNEVFAIKVIDKKSTSADKIKRFQNEINFCQKYSQSNIIKIIDYGTFSDDKNNLMFYVMPYFDSTLRNEINKGIEANKILPIFFQILDGLEFAHKKSVWHRDIKPENILIDSKTGSVVLADFGIASFCADEIITAVKTRDSDRLANFVYAAPEQKVKGSIVDGRADIFALGLILNEMFTKSVLGGVNFKKIAKVNPQFGYLDNFVDGLINYDPSERLYPINKILIDLKARIKEINDNNELNKLLNVQINNTFGDDPLFVAPQLVDAKYENECLILYLDKVTNSMWDNILLRDSFSHTSLANYPKAAFYSSLNKNRNCTVFQVKVISYNVSLLEDIIKHFKSWLPEVSRIYQNDIKRKRQEEIRRETEERERLIKEKETEININETLKSLFLTK